MKSVAFLIRPFFAIVVLGAIGYLGWAYYQESKNITATGLAERAAPPPGAPAGAQRPTALPPAVARRPSAPPGVYYATERVVVETATGVKALHPGEEVRLMYRYRNGKMLVTTGRDEFVVKPSSLSKDRPPGLPAAPRQP